MTFREATDILGMHAAEVAAALGVAPQTVRHYRLNPDADGYRPAPAGWRKVVARLARKRVPQLERLIEELEAVPDE